MMIKMSNGCRGLVVLAAAALMAFGCIGRTEYPTALPGSDGTGKPTDTTYVVMQPLWTTAGGLEFNHPRGVAFGYDHSVYICDTDNDRVVRLNVTGEYVEEYSVPHPVQITQDRQLNLLCVNGENVAYRRAYFGGGEFDTALFRDSLGVFIETQHMGVDSLFYDSLYVDTAWVESVWVEIQVVITDTVLVRVPTGFLGIAASPATDRYYFVPDTTRDIISILNVADHGLAGDIFRAYARPPAENPVGIMTYATGEDSYNIVFTQMSRYGGVRIVRSPAFEDVVLDDGDIYSMLPAGHKQITRDGLGNFLVVATTANEVYQFDKHGAFDLKFGGPGAEPGQFNGPHGIAWGEGVLYVADSYNNRIVRYQLSTDLQF